MSRHLPQLLATVVGVLLFGAYFSRHPVALAISQNAISYWQIIFGCSLVLGVVSFLRVNMKAMAIPAERPFRSLSLLGFAGMLLLAAVWGIGAGTPFAWSFDHLQAPMQATVFALLAFFVASASLRGFRARSGPAAVLLAAAAITLISRSDLLGYLPDQFHQSADWLRNYPSIAARRAILIGIGLGSLTTSLRIVLGIERTWLGGESK